MTPLRPPWRYVLSLVAFLATFLTPLVAAPLPPGFPNVPQTPGTLLSGLNEPDQGRLAIIAFHNGILFTIPEIPSSEPGSDYQVRTWDLTDPTAPVVLDTWGVTPMPINAHGYLKSGDYLILGPNWPPEAPWSFRADGPGAVERTTFPGLAGAGVRGSLFQPWFVGDTYWSYNDVSGNATIAYDGVELANWDHLGDTGVIGHPFLLGNLLIFASDQSRTGVATYDVSDPTNPVLLDVLTTGGPGGYWPELWGGDGHLYIVFPYRTGGNGFRVVDATDPTDLQLVADRSLPGDEAMYVQFQDEYAFIADHKVDMRSFESVLFLDGANATRPNDGGVGVSTSQFALPLGNLLITGGVGPDQGMAIWAHQAAPDTRGPSVGYHVPRAGQTGYPTGAPISVLIHETLETSTIVPGTTFIVRPLGGTPISGRWVFSFEDVLTFSPDAPLADDTTYEVVFPAGGIRDAAGNGMEAYSFTFSTGSSVGGNRPPSVGSIEANPHPIAPGQNVTVTVAPTDPDTDPVDVRFDFGDGSPSTAWSTTVSASHAFADPGHYRVNVQARDPSGSVSSASRTLTVTTPPSGPRPTHSAPIACAEGARRVWVVHPDHGTVAIVDADSLAVLFERLVCDTPRGLAPTSDGGAWVACSGDDRIVVLDSSGQPVDEIPTGYGSAPGGVVISALGDVAFVALEGSGQVRRYDVAGRTQTGEITVGPGPRALALSGDASRLWATRFLSPENEAHVWEIEAAAVTLTTTRTVAKFGGAANADGTAAGRGVANQLVATVLAPSGPSSGGRLWLAGNKPNVERGLFFADDLDTDNTVRNVVVQLDVTGGGTAAIDLDNSDSASALAFSPLGDYLFVTLQGNDEVVVLDALAVDQAAGLGSLVTRLATGGAPRGVCVDGPTGRTFVQDFLSRSVSVLETASLFSHGDKTVARTTVATAASEPLAPTVLAGKRLFYLAGDPRMSAEGYLSCATCHLDGGHDGRTWDFTGRGEGFRNTTDLRGRAGMAHGNVHWTANFDEIQDFENDIRGPFGGLGFLDDADFAVTQPPLGPPKAGLSPELDALADYVASLDTSSLPRSPFREPGTGATTVQARDGRLVFQAQGCTTCHSGDRYTDSSLGGATLHDVGTLRTTSGQRLGGPLDGIDTPTLLGVWSTSPYFHDGSAPSLEDVFRVTGGDVLPAEDGLADGGAFVVANYVDLNNDDTVHGRAFVALGQTGARLTLPSVDGGAGGLGDLELRYSTHRAQDIEVRVGTFTRSVTLEDVGNDPSWRHTNWRRIRIEDVPLGAGPVNDIEIVALDAFPNISLDDVLVGTADERGLADPHRRVLALSTADRDALLAFLRQLDGRPEDGPGATGFADSFESGDTSAWSATVP